MSYRKIYERHYGPIPKGFHVHHKDLNHENDDPLNLEALHPDDHANKHGFLNNFIMAQSTAIERSIITRKQQRWKTQKSQDMKGNTNGKGNRGKIHTNEHKHKACVSMLGKRNGVGSIRTEKWKQSQSELKRGKSKPRIDCPHCHASGGAPVMIRWHFQNCRKR